MYYKTATYAYQIVAWMKEEEADRREWSAWPLERWWAKRGVCEEGFLPSLGKGLPQPAAAVF